MSINRRSLLGMLALTSAYSLVRPGFANAVLADPPSAKQVFILLHGMFFLEFDLSAKKLIVATPVHNPHFFYTRLHGSSTLVALDRDPVLDVAAGNKTIFPAEILQFKRADIGANGPVLTSGTAQYRCRMILPYPKDILPLRRGPAGIFIPDTNTSLGKKIQIGTEIATVTCLVYDPGSKGPYVMSYYAEHPVRPNCNGANAALQAAQSLCGTGFNLKLKKCPAVDICTERDDELPDGVNADDEWGISELQGPVPCAHPLTPPAATKSLRKLAGDVSSCPQFGIQP